MILKNHKSDRGNFLLIRLIALSGCLILIVIVLLIVIVPRNRTDTKATARNQISNTTTADQNATTTSEKINEAITSTSSTDSSNASDKQAIKQTISPAPASIAVHDSTTTIQPSPSTAITASSSPERAVSVPSDITIPPQAIVGLLCFYTTTSTYLKELVGTPILFQSSGVIINQDGYILTAKHVVDPKWTFQVYDSSTPDATILDNNINFDHCDVSVPTVSSLFPASEIKAWNPSSLLPEPEYKAALYFDPPQGTLTQQQFDEADFAVLKITGVANDCSAIFGDYCGESATSTPETFPYVPAFFGSTPPIGTQLLTYGYPVEANPDYGTGRLYLKGAVGNVTAYDTSTYLNNTPLALRWNAGDILGGRSGSGMFWNGHLVGILYEKNNDQYWSQSVTVQAIQQILTSNGLGNLLQTQ